MRPKPLGLDSEALSRCFPFHFAIDRSLKILQVGPSLVKVRSRFTPGADLADLLSIQSPKLELEFESLVAQPRSPFMLELRDPTLCLRGQFLEIEAGEVALFVGSPWAHSMTELADTGLILGDFAAHDSTIEHLFRLNTQNAAVADARRIQERFQTEAAERAHLERVGRALENDLDAAGDFHLHASRTGQILNLHATPTLRALSNSELAGKRQVGEVLPALGEMLDEIFEKLDENELPHPFELSVAQADRMLTLDCRAAATLSGGALIVGRDVSDRRELETRLAHSVLHDPLTGLPNRSLLADRLEHARSVCRSDRNSSLLGLLFIDLKEFKDINDAMGHAVGDQLLKAVARRLCENLRPNDTAARLDGDCFAVLLDEIAHPSQALEIAFRLREEISQSMKLSEIEAHLDCRIGIAVNDGQASVDKLFAQAGMAMHRTKSEGEDDVGLFEGSMQERASHRLEVKRDLARALEANEIVVFFQPIVAIDTLQLVGVEALVRWQHPERGLLGPWAFIDVAEESELIVPLGARVMELALEQTAAWHRLGGPVSKLKISVNLSPKQLLQDDVPATFQRCVERAEIDPQRVTLEITESHAVADLKATVAVLDRLRVLGARIAMDDFGTGFSSLSYLEQLPIDVLKVDKAFIDRLGSGKNAPLAEWVISLGQTLGMAVVAEGIEEADQLEILRERGCEFGQGYLFARPLPAAELTAQIVSAAGPMPVYTIKTEED
ncbi:MAG: EAL domain-containing protein [bacterium]|nr:EAL domain-containing protein [bacterium]